MKLTLITFGTHGDCRRLIALGLGLQRARHEVVLLGEVSAAGLAAEHGLAFEALGGEFSGRRNDTAFVAGQKIAAPQLAAMIAFCQRPEVREKAKDLGRRLSEERGIENEWPRSNAFPAGDSGPVQ